MVLVPGRGGGHDAARLAVVGARPGRRPDWITPEASAALAEATDLVGYGPYLDRVAATGRARSATPATTASRSTARGMRSNSPARAARVAVVSGGDPGVFAMAAAVLEAIEAGDPAWRALDMRVLPGVTAMQAAAARLGAPLGHDFCAISLSDNLKPWALVERRLERRRPGDFVIALYNPASKARPGQLFDAFDAAARASSRARRRWSSPAPWAGRRARSRSRRWREADPGLGRHGTLVLVGSSETRFVERGAGDAALVYTPRSYGAGR